jgi:hypothetical protein
MFAHNLLIKYLVLMQLQTNNFFGFCEKVALLIKILAIFLKHVKSYKNIYIGLENARKCNYVITIFLQIEMNVN